MCHPHFSNELFGSKVVTNSLSPQKIGWNGNTGLKFTVDSLPIRFFGTLSVGLLGSLVGTLSVGFWDIILGRSVLVFISFANQN